MGVTSVPSLYLDGWRWQGPRTLEALRPVIELLLASKGRRVIQRVTHLNNWAVGHSHIAVLGFAAVWMLVMHLVDVYWMIMPALHEHGAGVGVGEVDRLGGRHPLEDTATFLFDCRSQGRAFNNVQDIRKMP